MSTQITLVTKVLAANLALVSKAISAMNSCQMSTQITLVTKLLAANLALVSSVRMLWSRRRRSGVALSMRRVVVSADR